MIFCLLLAIINLIPESIPLRLNKSKESKNTISSIFTMHYLMPLKIHSTPWNIESVVATRQESMLNSILSLKLMCSCQEHKYNLILLLKKSKKPSTKQLQLFYVAVKLFIIGTNKLLKMTKNRAFMRWLPKIKKLWRWFCYWQDQFKEQRTKLINFWISSINSNGYGRNPSPNPSNNSQKDQISHNSLHMKLSSRSSQKLKNR